MIFPGTLGLSFEAQFPSEQDPFSILPLRAVSSLEETRASPHLREGKLFHLPLLLKLCFFVFQTGRGGAGNFDFTAVKSAPVLAAAFALRSTEKPQLKNRRQSDFLKKKVHFGFPFVPWLLRRNFIQPPHHHFSPKYYSPLPQSAKETA